MPATLQNSRAWFWLLLGLAIAAFVVFELLSRRIIYVVPDDYSGLIDIAQDEHGDRLWPSLRGLVIDVPNSGLVRLRSITWLDRWSVTRAYERNGAALPVSIMGNQATGRRFWLMNSSGNHLYNFVGSEKELNQFLNQRGKAIYGIQSPSSQNQPTGQPKHAEDQRAKKE